MGETSSGSEHVAAKQEIGKQRETVYPESKQGSCHEISARGQVARWRLVADIEEHKKNHGHNVDALMKEASAPKGIRETVHNHVR